MNPELFELYQELVDAIVPLNRGNWETFKLRAEVDEIGYLLRLKFVEVNGVEKQFSPVPPSIFRIVEKIRTVVGPQLAWSEWIFHYNRSGKYDVEVKYED